MFSYSHDILIRGAFKMFLDKPLLGHGPKIFRKNCGDTRYFKGDFKCHLHPHNFYAQLLAETGILGFSFLFGLLLFFIYLMSKHLLIYVKTREKWLSDYQICLLAGLLITIWPFITTGNFFTNKLMLFYSLQMGFFKIEKRLNI
jgi:O-antigen ligase